MKDEAGATLGAPLTRYTQHGQPVSLSVYCGDCDCARLSAGPRPPCSCMVLPARPPPALFREVCPRFKPRKPAGETDGERDELPQQQRHNPQERPGGGKAKAKVKPPDHLSKSPDEVTSCPCCSSPKRGKMSRMSSLPVTPVTPGTPGAPAQPSSTPSDPRRDLAGWAGGS